ncbi:lysine N(6)-hydroxylase/L-ornithine N(5)-oxygenase family protein [Actinocorallia longicatena]|uniref:L-lysine N6-monooxygenase MbtG n=1 Tax=Actinocorallia longicatena TaxID=111803 RepID=A0ABP6QCR1_9ACTN
MQSNGLQTYDVVGVGFGPSNLSLAIALEEMAGAGRPGRMNSVFVERQPSLGWHRGMLLPGTKMQVSFLKDLVTFRNPLSRYTFVAYLHASGRLANFVNTKDFFPTRREFHSYLEWVGASFADRVTYGAEVVAVRPLADAGGAVDRMQVELCRNGDGGSELINARNIVVSTGLAPRVPDGIVRGRNTWHSSEFLAKYREREPGKLKRIAVVGAGQSGAEIVRFLYDAEPDAEIYAILPSYGYSVADNTPFANQIFDAGAVDDYYNSPEQSKRIIWEYHKNTNYSVVDDELINSLYQRCYQDDLENKKRLHVVNVARVRGAEAAGDTVKITVESMLTGRIDRFDVDLFVCATGYEPMDPAKLLGDLEGYCVRDAENRFSLERDYRVVTKPELRCGIYFQGGTEHTHGLSSSLLSNIAVRSGEIAESIARRRAQDGQGLDGADASVGIGVS